MNVENIVRNLQDYIISPTVSALKVALRSRPVEGSLPLSEKEKAHSLPARPLIIMGNGPSLRSFLDYAGAEGEEALKGFDLEAVNFAALTPEFFLLRPNLYVLADPHFFTLPSTDGKVNRLWENLARCDWPMTLWIPATLNFPAAGSEGRRDILAELPANISVRRMNLTPVEGRGPLANLLIDSGLGMPRPRNVLIPAIMTAIRSGYKKVFLVGADHSWSRTLWVDDENNVVSVQPHFYKDDEAEKERVRAEYAGYHLHDILNSLTVAFRSYFDIRRIAERQGVEIINATPESFIDAFPRCGYAQMMQQS
ncbi:MAG: hypothetical protein K2M31_09725 [Muribaculaceae bacterium]|nr:hypothetical protein [Muribaculaceae bacterium]